MAPRATRGRAVFLAVLAVVASPWSPLGCRRSTVVPAPEPSAVPAPAVVSAVRPPASVASADPSRLPEDPVAGQRSEQQWRKHMADEEYERQIGFDRRHLKEHQAVVALISTARARYDHATTEAAVSRASAGMPRQIDEIRRRVNEIDHWGVNSRLLADYEALAASLAKPYGDAKLAALKGDPRVLEGIRGDFDRHMKTIADWLEAAKESEDE